MEAIVITVISELITLAGVIATCWISHSKTLYRIEQLEKKQDRVNNIIMRTYECEKQIAVIQQQLED